MSIGKVSEFDLQCGVWSSYVDRLEMYFKVNEVKDELKLPTLIAVMGDDAYELLLNLASPKKPSELTFAEAKSLLQQHLEPKLSVLAERYRFRQRRQQAGENIASYIAELKKLARQCKFDSTGLNENLRDQFVCGLKSDVIRQRLFAENDSLTYNMAVKIACSLEAAERDAAAVEVPTGSGIVGAGTVASTVHALGAQQGAGRSRGRAVPRARQQAATQRTAAHAGCRRCGSWYHDTNGCRFQDYVCDECNKAGHLKRMCPERGERPGGARGGSSRRRRGAAGKGFHYGDANTRDASEDEETGGAEEELHQLCLNDYKAVSLPISIDSKIIDMEIDTGTAISCISKRTYDECFSHKEIEKYRIVLSFYDGSKIKPLGFIRCNVKYNDKVKQLELFVIEGGTTALIGRQWLAELGINIPKLKCNQMEVKNSNSTEPLNNSINKLIDRYKELFDGELGRYTGGKATLRVRAGAAPVFHRARPVPYALRGRVDAELDAMLRDGVIEPVDCSDWASPLVPVNKSDGALRICADYKATLNPVLLVDRYPLPRIEDVLVGLNGAKYFSKIDLSQAYNQVELDDTKNYTVINTHRGLFRYNRLVYGLASSPGIFQRIMCSLLSDIPNVEIFLDDVIITGMTSSQHLEALEAVFRRLSQNGLKLKRNKCVFLASEVRYLGYIVSKDGIKTDPLKIEAINKIPRPTNITELRSFLGLVNFYAKFVKNLSSILIPLYSLLKKGNEWTWTKECDKTFTEVKRILLSSEVLAHYNPNKPLFVTCDASARGVGGVLTQPGPHGERPVAYVSRTLNDAEKNYSQIHREALAIIFCMKKFHQYLYGRHFTLRTDHKPLVSIFGPYSGIPAMAASRMQRWAIILSAYTYNIEYVNSSANGADGLSRLPVSCDRRIDRDVPEQTFLHFAQDAFLLDYNEIKKCTARDPVLGRILSYIRDGWPSECDIAGLRPYFNRKLELYEELGCIMWGHRLVIPESCQIKVLKIIHEPHMGIVKSKAMARSYVWWAGIDEAIEATCRGCDVCAAQADAPSRNTIHPWPRPDRPWSRLHLDFLGPIFGKTYLVVVDSTSKWLEIFQVPSTASNFTIDKLTELFGRWGIPKQVVTDNGPPFTGKEFEYFTKYNGIEHIFTAPYHPSSNGAAENAVKTLKRVIKKAVQGKCSVDRSLNTFLLHYRNTEHSTTGESPATIMLGRRLRTRLDTLKPDRERKVRQAQDRQVKSSGGVERTVDTGDEVWYRQYLKSDKWVPGQVTGTLGPTNFKVLARDGRIVHRHVDQLKRRSRNSLVCPSNVDMCSGNTSEIEDHSSVPQKAHSPVRLSMRPVSPIQSEQSDDAASSSMASSAEPKDGNIITEPSGESTIMPVVPSSLERPIRKCRMDRKPLYKT